jgi:RNA-directed DNA polymerase
MKQNDYLKQKPNSNSTLSLLANLRSNQELLEDILSEDNIKQALDQVIRNKGCAGIDGMETGQLRSFLKEEWDNIKSLILKGSYKPSLTRIVEIPKSNGGKRKLGIPTVLDRLIQQAITQRLQHYIDGCFSAHSYGFRPNRSAHDAIFKSQQYIKEERKYSIDIDLEKYFDTVNHDKLMSKLARNIRDQRVLDLIRKYLNAGISLEREEREGVPQGSPLSPLLSNVYLHMLDCELERRKHKFVRYADDCRIFVRSLKAAERVMQSISRFLEIKLKLRVNQQKSRIDNKCHFLGYVITRKRLDISAANLRDFKYNIRMKTRRSRGISLQYLIQSLKPLINGWYEYFKYQSDKGLFKKLDSWIRRRLRAHQFCALKTGKNRLKEFTKAGLDYDTAYRFAYTFSGPWRTSIGNGMCAAMSNNYLKAIGLPDLYRKFS